jgi:hypothetical protein
VTGSDDDRRADRLAAVMVNRLIRDGHLVDHHWRDALATLPRHRFVPWFYEPNGNCRELIDVAGARSRRSVSTLRAGALWELCVETVPRSVVGRKKTADGMACPPRVSGREH